MFLFVCTIIIVVVLFIVFIVFIVFNVMFGADFGAFDKDNITDDIIVIAAITKRMDFSTSTSIPIPHSHKLSASFTLPHGSTLTTKRMHNTTISLPLTPGSKGRRKPNVKDARRNHPQSLFLSERSDRPLQQRQSV